MRLKIFLNRSANFVSVSSFAMRQMRAAIASLHLWYTILWCFFCNTDSGVDVFLNTALLSQNISVGLLSSTPNMRSLYYNAITNWDASSNTLNSDPKVDVSAELCFLLSHITVTWLQNINMPVCYQLVTLSDAWSTSSKQCVDIVFPLGCGISSRIASFASQ